MNWKEIFGKKVVRRGICLLLIVAILIGLFAPGVTLHRSYPDNPVGDVEIQDMNVLSVGSNRNDTDQSEMEEEEDGQGVNDKKEEDSETTEKQEESNMAEENTDPSEDENPLDTDQKNPDTGQGEEGQEDGNQGEEGGQEAELDLAAVMTWYKYGTEPKTIVCGPSEQVGKTLNTAQLVNQELKYEFFLTGEMADEVKITSVMMQKGNDAKTNIDQDGKITIELSERSATQDYTFTVVGHMKTRDGQGNAVEEDVVFTFVIHCEYKLDLEMELNWTGRNEQVGVITCGANETAARTVESNQLNERVFAYTPVFTGTLADNARIVKADYVTASGKSGTLDPEGGTLIFGTEDNKEEEKYYLTFEVLVKDEEGKEQQVFYKYYIRYVDTLDIQLSFTWMEKGVTKKTLVCQPNGHVKTQVKKNQLSAGTVKYEIELTGADSANARILNLSYESEATGGGRLNASGAIPFELPEGYISNQYKISALVLVNGKQFVFEIILDYSMDISLEMSYSVWEDGTQKKRTVLCENGKSKTADVVYDDQLKNGILEYEFGFAGEDVSGLTMTSITCYRSGNGRIQAINSSGTIELLLKNGKTGENAFSITAEDKDGMVYEFRINVPYKHRGENSIKITTNLVEGQVVTNETKTNLNVRAWSEDADGNLIGYIPANGTDTRLIVMLDGEVLSYISTSGSASEYVIYPANPEKGDTNTHVLSIYAEDAFGNFGELTINLKGQRSQDGQKKGKATIYIDMTALGMGVVDSVSYEVLAGEPISYVVAKAILGMDTGEPFGAAANSLGWKGRYSGSLDTGFYLQSLSPGLKANTLEGSRWNLYGSNEKEILKAIDDRFGAGTGLATLWRCIYRNGLNKSSGSDGEYSEHDYTSGSGWLFSLDGTYYPGLSMADYSLEDGDVLTLRYTLAYGWDVGSGTPGWGNNVGYCVTALNGSYTINHQMEKVENPDGSFSYMCHCCGLVEGCAHENVVNKDMGDGTHRKYCEDCKKNIGDPELHVWETLDDTHKCTFCQTEEEHNWKEVAGSNTATCIAPGKKTVNCTVCKMTREEESPATGHALNNRWNHTAKEHYQKCSVCGEVIEESKGTHQYVYNAADDDWYCKICNAGHDWDYCGNNKLIIDSATCKKIENHCSDCGLTFVKEGEFEAYHAYSGGNCMHCGKKDPDYVESENPGGSGDGADGTTESGGETGGSTESAGETGGSTESGGDTGGGTESGGETNPITESGGEEGVTEIL